jgi:hypothetical protein
VPWQGDGDQSASKGEDVPEGATFVGNPARAVATPRRAAPAVALPAPGRKLRREIDRETVAIRRFSKIRIPRR